MHLPIEISPVPIISANLEIRYKTDLDINDYGKSLMLTLNKINNNIQITPNYVADNEGNIVHLGFMIKNDDFGFSFNQKSFLFQIFNTYSSWQKYFQFVKVCLEVVYDLKIIKEIDRVGLRYNNIFKDKFDEILERKPHLLLPLENSFDEFYEYRTFFKFNNYDFIVQLYSNKGKEQNSKLFSYIDIDAFKLDLSSDYESLIDTIDNLHLEEKKLFFHILNKNYLLKLNPVYNGGTNSTSI